MSTLLHITTRRVSIDEVLDLRALVLRPNLKPNQCRFDYDSAASCFSLGAFVEQEAKPMSVVTFFEQHMPNIEKEISAQTHYRLRAMATHPDYRQRGLGRKLIDYGISLLKERGVGLCWFNARIKAVPFYQKCGFAPVGEVFHIEGIGDHYLMYKLL